MTLADALRGSALPQAEAEILVARALGVDRAYILAHPERVLTPEEAARCVTQFERRRSGEPMGYVLGEVEFLGRMFKTDARALIPRSPTESIVELAMEFLETQMEEVQTIDTGIVGWSRVLHPDAIPVTTIVDVGTGAGCIAVSCALERPDLHIIGTDISADAISLATENAKRLGANNIEFRIGDGLEPVRDLSENFLLLSNPPYIPQNRALAHEVQDFEPHVALFGGGEGIDLGKRLIRDARTMENCLGYIFESESEQRALLEKQV